MKKRRYLVIRLRLLFINMYLAPWKNIRKKDPETSGAKRRKRPGRRSFKRIIRLIKVMYASLAIKRLRADIDTGDFPLNAQLIPLALLINGANHQLSINFEDRNELEVTIQTRLIKIIWKYFTIHN